MYVTEKPKDVFIAANGEISLEEYTLYVRFVSFLFISFIQKVDLETEVVFVLIFTGSKKKALLDL